MVDKSNIQDLNENLTARGMVIPTDYVVMKKGFKKELCINYLAGLPEGAVVLDMNPGFEGLYNDIDTKKITYIALEQNKNIRSFLAEKKVTVHDWEIPHIPLADNSVDYILSTPFIEHVPTYVDAINVMIEWKRILRQGGKVLIIVPNYLNMGNIFYEDYKHGWVTTKKRICDMLSDCGFRPRGVRYTIGWITMAMNPLTALIRFLVWCFMALTRLYIVNALLEVLKLDTVVNKIKKTVFELIVIEASWETVIYNGSSDL